jgi:hypothetical protein
MCELDEFEMPPIHADRGFCRQEVPLLCDEALIYQGDFGYKYPFEAAFQ